jgi:Vitamin K-dependent gamma-carboxylase
VSRLERFWFEPTDAATLGLVRIAFGAVTLLWTVSLARDLGPFFAPQGLIGEVDGTSDPWAWSLLDVVHSDLAVGALYVALLSGAVGVLVGWHTRVSAAVVLVALVSFERANPYVFNSGDGLLRLLALYVTIAPSGLAFSLDARRRGTAEPAYHPIWSLRLIQIQVSAMYLGAVWSKLDGTAWRDGTAAVYATGLPDLVRFPAFDLLGRSTLAAHAATYGTMLMEAALVVGLWHRRTRVYALAAGITFHLAIDLSIRVGFFTLAVFTAYLSFADPGRVRALVDAAQRGLRHRRTRVAH